MLRHKAWMSNVAYYVGVLALIWAAWASPLWLLVALPIYLLGGFTLSVGYHRLFCHGSFKTSRFWHGFWATSGVLFMYSSPLQWAITHATHHRHSDTERDPHEGPLKAASLLRKGYRDVPLMTIKGRRLLRDPIHYFVDKHYAGIWLAFTALMVLVSWEFFVYAYLPAVGAAHLVASMHQFVSHIGNSPKNLWFMEYLMPSAGEWLHKTHHEHPGWSTFRTKPWHLDTGSLVISLTRSRA
jgi:stearoyl-CoA desaturase (delta-9 desaturase)